VARGGLVVAVPVMVIRHAVVCVRLMDGATDHQVHAASGHRLRASMYAKPEV
jgi:hypothetical protein